MNKRVLVAAAGWEERFLKGCLADIESFDPELVVVFYSEKYEKWTSKNIALLSAECDMRSIRICTHSLDSSEQTKKYLSLINVLSEYSISVDSMFRFDATTAPRDVIWAVSHFVSVNHLHAEFSYYKPLSYGDWLSRDAEMPKLMLKRSGVMYPDQPTLLLILSGYADHRLGQLISKFEPKLVMVGKQTGEQFDNSSRNRPTDVDFGIEIDAFEFDNYDCSELNLQLLYKKIAPYIDNHNIVATSLGPKPGAFSLFRLTNLVPSMALAYIGAREYNNNYSSGFDPDGCTLAQIA